MLFPLAYILGDVLTKFTAINTRGGILQGTGMLVYILIGWLFKTGVEVVCLPITYRVIAKMKQIENIDTYDNKTNFTPFRVDLD